MSKVTHAYLDKLIEEHPKLVQPRQEDLDMYLLAKKGLNTQAVLDDMKDIIVASNMSATIAYGEELHNDIVKIYEQVDNVTIKKVLAEICDFIRKDLEDSLEAMEKFVNSKMPKGKNGNPA